MSKYGLKNLKWYLGIGAVILAVSLLRVFNPWAWWMRV